MKSLLEKFAIAIVMFHMTFGCSFHHGLGGEPCLSQCNSAAICGNHVGEVANDCCHDGHQNLETPHSPKSTILIDGDDSNHGPEHLGCQGDGCSVTQQVRFVYSPLDFSNQYLGGIESISLASSLTTGQGDSSPFENAFLPPAGVRAHLFFGVQIV